MKYINLLILNLYKDISFLFVSRIDSNITDHGMGLNLFFKDKSLGILYL